MDILQLKIFVKLGISKTSIPELLDKKSCEKWLMAYIDNNLIEDEFYIFAKRFSNIIFFL